MRRMLIYALLLCSLAATTHAQEAATAQINRNVNVRSGPGTEYTVLRRLQVGDTVQLTGRSASNHAWLRILLDTREGWLIRYGLDTEADLTGLSAVSPRTPVRIPAAGSPVLISAFRTVNIRSAPSTRSDTLAQLRDGEKITAVGRSDTQNSWIRVDLDGAQGWVAYFTITAVTDDLETLPLVRDEDEDETLISGVVAHVFRTVNIRSGPGSTFDQIGQLQNGDMVAVTGRSDTGNNWLRVETDSGTGWVAYFTVSITGSLDSLPVISLTAPS